MRAKVTRTQVPLSRPLKEVMNHKLYIVTNGGGISQLLEGTMLLLHRDNLTSEMQYNLFLFEQSDKLKHIIVRTADAYVIMVREFETGEKLTMHFGV